MDFRRRRRIAWFSRGSRAVLTACRTGWWVDLGRVRVERVREFGEVSSAWVLWQRLGPDQVPSEWLPAAQEEIDWATTVWRRIPPPALNRAALVRRDVACTTERPVVERLDRRKNEVARGRARTGLPMTIQRHQPAFGALETDVAEPARPGGPAPHG